MKQYRTIPVIFAIFSSVLSAKPATVQGLSAKVSELEEQVATLESELATTKAYLREVSRVTMADRLVITVSISESGGITMEGVGFDGRDLGGKALEKENFVERIKSISEDYAKPKMIFSGDQSDPDFEANHLLIKQLCGRAKIHSTTIVDTAEQTNKSKNPNKSEMTTPRKPSD